MSLLFSFLFIIETVFVLVFVILVDFDGGMRKSFSTSVFNNSDVFFASSAPKFFGKVKNSFFVVSESNVNIFI